MDLITESEIDGTFSELYGGTRYRLANGQEWHQVEPKPQTRLAHRPAARIWKHHMSYYLEVDGMDKVVEVFPIPSGSASSERLPFPPERLPGAQNAKTKTST